MQTAALQRKEQNKSAELALSHPVNNHVDSKKGVGTETNMPLFLERRFSDNRLSSVPMQLQARNTDALHRETQLATTKDGVTSYAPELDQNSISPRINAHEAVHRDQFRAGSSGLPIGNRAQLEADACRGADVILQGRTYRPGFAAPGGLSLHFGIGPSPWLPDPQKTVDREQTAAQLLKPVSDKDTSTKLKYTDTATDRVQYKTFESSTSISGRNGTIQSTTYITIIYDPGDPKTTVLTNSINPASEIGPPIEVPAYPVRILYSRVIDYSDADGRTCQVNMNGNVHFTHKKWQDELAGREPSFESLQELMGDTGYLHVELDGESPIPDFHYFMHFGIPANSLRVQQDLAATMKHNYNRGFSSLVSSRDANFVFLNAAAGEQFIALQKFLFSADANELQRRYQEKIKELLSSEEDSESWLESAVSYLGGKIKDAWNAIPAPVRGVLKALGKAALAIGAVIGTAALIVLLSPVELTVGAVALVLGGAMLLYGFVSSLFRRSEEAAVTGEGSTLGVIGSALGDVVGVSGIYESVYDESILSGVPLNRSEEERWEGGTMGAIQLVATFLGLRAAIKRTPLYGKTTSTADTSLQAGEGATDPYGNIRYSPSGSAADQALALKHEGVHSMLSPKLKLLRGPRARFGMRGYDKSSLLRYVEEALAETRAQLRVNGIKGIPDGITFPLRNGYVRLLRPGQPAWAVQPGVQPFGGIGVLPELAIGSVIYGGVIYTVYYVADSETDSDGIHIEINEPKTESGR